MLILFFSLLMKYRWEGIEFPEPFGRTMSAAEEEIHRMDEKVQINSL
jgi:hypothetical protein